MPATLLIKKDENTNVPDTGGRWRAGELVTVLPDIPPSWSGEFDTNIYYTFTVTDKTLAEVKAFIARYNYHVQMTVYNGSAPGQLSIYVRNENANQSETLGGWTVAQTDDIIARWNALYPTCNLTTLGFPQYDTWDCTGFFETGLAAEFEDVITQRGLSEIVRMSQWLISPAGMANIAAAGGRQSGTAAQLNGILDNRVDS